MMSPASGFYSTEGYGKNEVRLAYVLNKEDLANALNVLEKAIETYNQLRITNYELRSDERSESRDRLLAIPREEEVFFGTEKIKN